MKKRRLTVFTDGASRGNPGPAGAAAVLMDESGACLDEVFRYLGQTTNNVAEYNALIMGLARARDLGAEAVEVVTDSELLARQWSGEYRVKNKTLRPLFEEAKELARNFGEIEVRHVPRSENSRADAAANRAIDEKIDS